MISRKYFFIVAHKSVTKRLKLTKSIRLIAALRLIFPLRFFPDIQTGYAESAGIYFNFGYTGFPHEGGKFFRQRKVHD